MRAPVAAVLTVADCRQCRRNRPTGSAAALQEIGRELPQQKSHRPPALTDGKDEKESQRTAPATKAFSPPAPAWETPPPALAPCFRRPCWERHFSWNPRPLASLPKPHRFCDVTQLTTYHAFFISTHLGMRLVRAARLIRFDWRMFHCLTEGFAPTRHKGNYSHRVFIG